MRPTRRRRKTNSSKQDQFANISLASFTPDRSRRIPHDTLFLQTVSDVLFILTPVNRKNGRQASAGFAEASITHRMTDLIADLSVAITSDGAEDDSDGDKGNDWFFSELADKLRTDRRESDIKTTF